MITKSEVIQWVNNQLPNASLSKVEQLGSGTVYCQLVNHFAPNTINPSKIVTKPKTQVDFISNLKLLNQALPKVGVKRTIDMDRLSKMSFQDNYDLIVCLYKTLTNRSQAQSERVTPQLPVRRNSKTEQSRMVEEVVNNAVLDEKSKLLEISKLFGFEYRSASNTFCGPQQNIFNQIDQNQVVPAQQNQLFHSQNSEDMDLVAGLIPQPSQKQLNPNTLFEELPHIQEPLLVSRQHSSAKQSLPAYTFSKGHAQNQGPQNLPDMVQDQIQFQNAMQQAIQSGIKVNTEIQQKSGFKQISFSQPESQNVFLQNNTAVIQSNQKVVQRDPEAKSQFQSNMKSGIKAPFPTSYKEDMSINNSMSNPFMNSGFKQGQKEDQLGQSLINEADVSSFNTNQRSTIFFSFAQDGPQQAQSAFPEAVLQSKSKNCNPFTQSNSLQNIQEINEPHSYNSSQHKLLELQQKSQQKLVQFQPQSPNFNKENAQPKMCEEPFQQDSVAMNFQMTASKTNFSQSVKREIQSLPVSKSKDWPLNDHQMIEEH